MKKYIKLLAFGSLSMNAVCQVPLFGAATRVVSPMNPMQSALFGVPGGIPGKGAPVVDLEKSALRRELQEYQMQLRNKTQQVQELEAQVGHLERGFSMTDSEGERIIYRDRVVKEEAPSEGFEDEDAILNPEVNPDQSIQRLTGPRPNAETEKKDSPEEKEILPSRLPSGNIAQEGQREMPKSDEAVSRETVESLQEKLQEERQRRLRSFGGSFGSSSEELTFKREELQRLNERIKYWQGLKGADGNHAPEVIRTLSALIVERDGVEVDIRRLEGLVSDSIRLEKESTTLTQEKKALAEENTQQQQKIQELKAASVVKSADQDDNWREIKERELKEINNVIRRLAALIEDEASDSKDKVERQRRLDSLMVQREGIMVELEALKRTIVDDVQQREENRKLKEEVQSLRQSGQELRTALSESTESMRQKIQELEAKLKTSSPVVSLPVTPVISPTVQPSSLPSQESITDTISISPPSPPSFVPPPPLPPPTLTPAQQLEGLESFKSLSKQKQSECLNQFKTLEKQQQLVRLEQLKQQEQIRKQMAELVRKQKELTTALENLIELKQEDVDLSAIQTQKLLPNEIVANFKSELLAKNITWAKKDNIKKANMELHKVVSQLKAVGKKEILTKDLRDRLNKINGNSKPEDLDSNIQLGRDIFGCNQEVGETYRDLLLIKWYIVTQDEMLDRISIEQDVINGKKLSNNALNLEELRTKMLDWEIGVQRVIAATGDQIEQQKLQDLLEKRLTGITEKHSSLLVQLASVEALDKDKKGAISRKLLEFEEKELALLSQQVAELERMVKKQPALNSNLDSKSKTLEQKKKRLSQKKQAPQTTAQAPKSTTPDVTQTVVMDETKVFQVLKARISEIITERNANPETRNRGFELIGKWHCGANMVNVAISQFSNKYDSCPFFLFVYIIAENVGDRGARILAFLKYLEALKTYIDQKGKQGGQEMQAAYEKLQFPINFPAGFDDKLKGIIHGLLFVKDEVTQQETAKRYSSEQQFYQRLAATLGTLAKESIESLSKRPKKSDDEEKLEDLQDQIEQARRLLTSLRTQARELKKINQELNLEFMALERGKKDSKTVGKAINFVQSALTQTKINAQGVQQQLSKTEAAFDDVKTKQLSTSGSPSNPVKKDPIESDEHTRFANFVQVAVKDDGKIPQLVVERLEEAYIKFPSNARGEDKKMKEFINGGAFYAFVNGVCKKSPKRLGNDPKAKVQYVSKMLVNVKFTGIEQERLLYFVASLMMAIEKTYGARECPEIMATPLIDQKGSKKQKSKEW